MSASATTTRIVWKRGVHETVGMLQWHFWHVLHKDDEEKIREYGEIVQVASGYFRWSYCKGVCVTARGAADTAAQAANAVESNTFLSSHQKMKLRKIRREVGLLPRAETDGEAA